MLTRFRVIIRLAKLRKETAFLRYIEEELQGRM